MSRLNWSLLGLAVSGVLFFGLLFWGLSGPSAGPIQNPLPASGTVALTGVDGDGAQRRCSVQALFEVEGKRYLTRQREYSPELCRFRLGERIELAYNSALPAQSAVLQRISDPPLWPALLAGLPFLVFLPTSILLGAAAWRSRPARRLASAADQVTGGDALAAPESSTVKPRSERQLRPTPGLTPPGWYRHRGRLRWWDGGRWTDNWQDG